MAVHVSLEKQFRKYLPPNELVLATASSEPIFGEEKLRICVSDRRVAVLERRGWFAWGFSSLELQRVRTVWIDEGTFQASIILVLGESNQVRIDNVSKSDARDFAAAVNAGLAGDQEVLAQRTKVCPVCDEIVKFRASRCKHCGADL